MKLFWPIKIFTCFSCKRSSFVTTADGCFVFDEEEGEEETKTRFAFACAYFKWILLWFF